jgi:outer membrane protein TolC
MIKQEILLEAKLVCIELIYFHKRKNELIKRFETADRIYNYLNTKLDKGDLNIMEVNKAKLQVVILKSEIELNEIEIKHLNTKLEELNGGKKITFADTVYPVFEIPAFTVLEGEIETYDPLLKHLNSEYRITRQEIDVNEALRLPKIEIGYRYKNQLNGNFNGFHAGISIPLWEKNNTVKVKELQALYTKSLIEEHKNEHYYEVKQLYDRYISFQNTINESKDIINTIDNIPLYEKALFAGEISSIEYLLETTYLYSMIDKMDELDKEMNITLADLLKHKLIEKY